MEIFLLGNVNQIEANLVEGVRNRLWLCLAAGSLLVQVPQMLRHSFIWYEPSPAHCQELPL